MKNWVNAVCKSVPNAKTLALGATFLLVLAVPSSATTVLWDFGGNGAACGDKAIFSVPVGCTLPVGSSTTTNSYALSEGGYVLTAYGFSGSGTGTSPGLALFWKGYNGNGGDEHGLGFVSTTQNELTLSSLSAIANFITVDVGTIDATFTNPQIRVQSVTGGESYDVFGSNSLGNLVGATKVITGQTTDNGFVPLPNWGTYQYYTLAVHTLGNATLADNVLFDSIQADAPSTPEPATWTFLAVGAGLLLFGRKRFTRG